MRVFTSMKKWPVSPRPPFTMHSKVEAEFRPTARPKRSASSSIFSSVARSSSRAAAAALATFGARRGGAPREPLLRDGDLEELLLVHLREQSRPPSETHHCPLPRSWISLCRVSSMLSSRTMFLSSPTPAAFTSERISRTAPGAAFAAHARHSDARGLSLDAREDALALAAAAADRLEAHALARVCLEERGAARSIGLGELVDGVEVDRAAYDASSTCSARGADPRRRRATRPRPTDHARARHSAAPRGRVLAQEQARVDVVDARRDAHALAQRRALGLVLLAGGRLHSRARADEAMPERSSVPEGRVLGHEAVAREDVRVAVPLCRARRSPRALLALGLRRAAVVAHAVNVLGRDVTQLGRERVRVDDGVLLAEEDPRVRDAHLREDVERLLADRSSADDERAHVLAREASAPTPRRACSGVDRP
jgi:hypothetical protein